MNILFVLYGDLSSNSANPLTLYARELSKLGHTCAIAVPYHNEKFEEHNDNPFRLVLYSEAITDPDSVFPDGRPADVLHVCTCRESVRRFVASYMPERPTPLVIYLEDHEPWISLKSLGVNEQDLYTHTEEEISNRLPQTLSHPMLWDSFVGLADAVAIIQGKLQYLVPPWVYCDTVMVGVDFAFFSPKTPDPNLREQYGINPNERIIVYHGGYNEFVKPALETLCQAIGEINQKGYPCRLLRTGPFPLDFLEHFSSDLKSVILDLGVLPKKDLPDLLALADVFVQPGHNTPFEDLRLPGKIPEFLAMGRPLLIPDANISDLFTDGMNVIILRHGSAEEIATKCIDVFKDPKRANKIGREGRKFGKKYFDVKSQAHRLEKVYKTACNNFNPTHTREIWGRSDQNPSMTMLLARKLQLLGESGRTEFPFDVGEILKKYAQHLESLVHRFEGMEAIIAREKGNQSSQSQQFKKILNDRDDQLSFLKQQVISRGGQVAFLNQALAERDTQFDQLNHQAIVRDSLLNQAQHQVQELGAKVAQLHRQVGDRDLKVSHLHKQFIDLTQQVSKLNQMLTDRNNEIEQLHHHIADRDSKLLVLDQLLVGYEESKSWKITTPLRMAGDRWRGIRNIASIFPAIIRSHGGIFNVLKKTVCLYRNEGIQALRNGMRNKLYGPGTLSPGPAIQMEEETFERNDYAEWIKRFESPATESRDTILQSIETMSRPPLISIIMPTYNSEPKWLIEAIESVRNQIYPNWELCIADDASKDTTIRSILEGYTSEDSRIKTVFREKNGHISTASNDALTLATGEWIALLDHDDVLPPHALYCVADAIQGDPQVQLIYSDEDKIDDKGQRFQPYFKPDWNVDLFYSHNLITHLGVYRADLVKKIGGFREGFEGAQDYDLALRCVEHLEHHEIVHIPRVLYHWRVHKESTAQAVGVKPYSRLAGEKALNEHLQRRGIKGEARQVPEGYRVSYDLPEPLPLVTIIIPTRNALSLIRQCIDSIVENTKYSNYEILIVDNESDDIETLQYFKSIKVDPRIRIIRLGGPFNFSALNNAAVKQAKGTFVGLVNNDITVIAPNWLAEMVSIANQPQVGAVGARLWYPNDTLQHGGVVLGVGGVAGHSHKGSLRGCYGYFSRMSVISGFSATTGACLVIKKSIYEQVGGFNEEQLPVAFNDIDFCLRVLKLGYRNVWTPYADMYHLESASRGFEDIPEKQARFRKEIEYMKSQWNDVLLDDPAYNPNLTLEYEDFSLAWPPRSRNLQKKKETFAEDSTGKSELSRVDKVMKEIDRMGLGLEIRPRMNPLASKRDGYHVHILDHFSTEELRRNYQGQMNSPLEIEDIDYVWNHEPLHELIDQEHYYDWIIGSHVIEHIPDLISFLLSCEKLLKPTGILSFAISDKRYCFDHFHAATSTGELLDAYERKLNRPTPGKVFDHSANAAKCNGQMAWGPHVQGDIELVHSRSYARTNWEIARSTEVFIDIHTWWFTPSSFSLLISDLRSLGLTKLAINSRYDTTGCEFFVSLVKKPEVSGVENANRLDFLNSIKNEEGPSS